MSFERQATAKDRLKMDWDFPVYTPRKQKATSGTVAQEVRRALDRDVAFATITRNDQRPLLVLRECNQCKGTDDALLDRRMSNEQTLLMARWFHCIKLPDSVLQDDHPFHALFPDGKPPHLFLCDVNGEGVIAMDGDQTQTELWKAMLTVLRRSYERDAEVALKERQRILNAYDTLDSRRSELEQRYSQELEKRGPDSPKLKAIQRDLDKIAAEHKALEQREREVMDLGAKVQTAEAAKPAVAPAGADVR